MEGLDSDAGDSKYCSMSDSFASSRFSISLCTKGKEGEEKMDNEAIHFMQNPLDDSHLSKSAHWNSSNERKRRRGVREG